MNTCTHNWKHSFEGEIILFLEFKCTKCGITTPWTKELDTEVRNSPTEHCHVYTIQTKSIQELLDDKE